MVYYGTIIWYIILWYLILWYLVYYTMVFYIMVYGKLVKAVEVILADCFGEGNFEFSEKIQFTKLVVPIREAKY